MACRAACTLSRSWWRDAALSPEVVPTEMHERERGVGHSSQEMFGWGSEGVHGRAAAYDYASGDASRDDATGCGVSNLQVVRPMEPRVSRSLSA
jgi:hypothetical protein